MAAGTRRRATPKRNGKPFMKCRLAGKRELKTPVATSEHRPSVQATAAKRAPGGEKVCTEVMRLSKQLWETGRNGPSQTSFRSELITVL